MSKYFLDPDRFVKTLVAVLGRVDGVEAAADSKLVLWVGVGAMPCCTQVVGAERQVGWMRAETWVANGCFDWRHHAQHDLIGQPKPLREIVQEIGV
jgi:hypothetical protein